MELRFSERLDELMEEKQLSALALAKLIHIDDSTISRWRNGSVIPTIDKLNLLCDFFGVTANYLLGRED